MTTNKMKEQIEPYLLGHLDAEQMSVFEQAVAADSVLAAEVERMRAIVGAFEQRGEAQAREALLRLGSEQELREIIRRAEGRRTHRRRMARIGVWCTSAAAVAGLILFVGSRPEYSPEILYETYFTVEQHFESAPSRGGDMPEDVLLNHALELLSTGQTDAAIEVLHPLADDNQAELQDAARWNLALALLREGYRRESVTLLDALISGRGEFAAKAAELKAKIKERRWF